MKLYDLKVNGMDCPLGVSYVPLRCSWKVSETESTKQKNGRIEVSKDSAFKKILYSREERELNSLAAEIPMDLEPETRYFIRVSILGELGDTGSKTTYFETGKMSQPWTAKWIGPMETDKFHPVLAKEFHADKSICSARLYICGLGCFEAWINGKKAGDDYLAPFLNDYKSCLQYETYDVTDLISQEKDTQKIDIFLGNGWYKGNIGYSGRRAVFGERFAAIAELVLKFSDGTSNRIVTDSSWDYYGSDIEESDIYDGEVLNRLLWNKKENARKKAAIVSIETPLVERYSLPVKVKEEVCVKEILHTPAGETVLDMGQNFTGYMSFEADFKPGTEILLEYGEVLQNGNFYRDNYRAAKARFKYISDGRKESVRAHFTFNGFRFVRVNGWPKDLSMNSFVGKSVYSDLEVTGNIETSNAKLNQLFSNCLWGQKSNFLDIPTDCPQRDERLGWTGDAQVFASTASYNMDTRAFYGKYLKDLRAEQLRCDGAVASYIPMLEPNAGSSVWGDAATFIPSILYEYYGDRYALQEQYPLMKDWVDYITRKDKERGQKYLFDFGFHFGDWISLDGVTEQSFKGATEDAFIASAYYYESVRKLSVAAGTLGYTEDAVMYTKLADSIKSAFYKEYFTGTGRLSIDTQTAYYICLKFKLYPQKDRILDGLVKRLKKDCYSIKGGFVGATMMCTVLAENGMSDISYHFLLKEDFPSWLYCVNLGATTIWERWNSLLPDGTISGTGMNSLNHYAYGSVMEFVYRDVAGIKPLLPGFKKIGICPMINNKLEKCNCNYDSAAGKIVSAWSIDKTGRIRLHVEIPFNTTAEITLPLSGKKPFEVEAGTYSYEYQPNKNILEKYSMNSRLEDFKEDKEAMKILQERLPIAYEMILSGDKENLSLSIRELKYMGFLGFTEDAVMAASNELLKLKIKY